MAAMKILGSTLFDILCDVDDIQFGPEFALDHEFPNIKRSSMNPVV